MTTWSPGLSCTASPGSMLPGYGWIFGMGDGRVNVGLGVLNSSVAFGHTNYRAMLADWFAAMPQEWGLRTRRTRRARSRAPRCPWASTGFPHYSRGVMLVGDCGGMVNPFNGEGIAYAMESGALAAEVAVQALARRPRPARERALAHVLLRPLKPGMAGTTGWVAGS